MYPLYAEASKQSKVGGGDRRTGKEKESRGEGGRERDSEDERGFQTLETQRYLPRFVVRFVPRRDSAAGADYAMRGHERSESRTRHTHTHTHNFILALRTCASQRECSARVCVPRIRIPLVHTCVSATGVPGCACSTFYYSCAVLRTMGRARARVDRLTYNASRCRR